MMAGLQAEVPSGAARLTTLDELKQNISLLAGVEESETPFISVYLDLRNGPDGINAILDRRTDTLRRILKGNDLADLENAMDQVRSWLETELLDEAKGVAIFVRGLYGGAFMLPMQFAVPLPNWIAVYPTPNIYHLVELKDTYHRYVVMIAMPERASILDVNLGAVTRRVWLDQAELRARVGSEWVRPHYQVNQKHRGERYVREKISMLENLMNSGGHTHLILAGEPGITSRVRRALPDHLAEKLVNVVPVDESDGQSDVVLSTLSAFIEHEKRQARTITERLVDGLRAENLAVAGTAATLDALRWSEVDTLVISADYSPDPGWSCWHCREMGAEAPEDLTCGKCGQSAVRPMDVKEALLRLAGQLERPIGVVESSDELDALGGVGCLLRFRSDARQHSADQLPQTSVA